MYFATSFLSVVGDGLFYFGLPMGLGVSTGSVANALLIFIVAPVVVLATTLLAPLMAKRTASARSDYAWLLIGLGLIEVVVAHFALGAKDQTLVYLCVSFVVLYAIVKEGLPRLFYNVSIYRYFFDDQAYEQAVGIDKGLNIAGMLIGTALAGWLIASESWQYVMIIDAATFLIFGACVLLLGKDVADKITVPGGTGAESTLPITPASITKSADAPRLALSPVENSILLANTVMIGVQSLFWPILPLVADSLGVGETSTNIYLNAALSLPGIIIGMFFSRIVTIVSKSTIVLVAPSLAILSTGLFLAVPNLLTMSIIFLVGGLFAGVFESADYSIRNMMATMKQIKFNTVVTRYCAVAQIISACCAYFFLDSPEIIKYLMLLTVATGLLWYLNISRNRYTLATPIAALAVLGMSLAYKKAPDERIINVEFDELATNYVIDKSATYLHLSVLLDSSAHLLRIGTDLTLHSEVLKSHTVNKDGTVYTLHLDHQYRSIRGEKLTATDVVYSIEYLQEHQRNLIPAFNLIAGATSCGKPCSINGLVVIDEFTLEVTLSQTHHNFLKELAIAQFVLLKKDRPDVEEIGDCQISYQTGRTQMVRCNAKEQWFKTATHQIVLRAASSDETTAGDTNTGVVPSEIRSAASSKAFDEQSNSAWRIATELRSLPGQPSLTNLSFLGSPTNLLLQPKLRRQYGNLLRERTAAIAERLQLNPANTYVSTWLSQLEPADLSSTIRHEPNTCPVRALKIAIDQSVHDRAAIASIMREAPCPIDVINSNGLSFFESFEQVDYVLAWFSPTYLASYDLISVYDCNDEGLCYFDWHDRQLQAKIDLLRNSYLAGAESKLAIAAIEEIVRQEGYVIGVAEMNWWLTDGQRKVPAHPAGFAQIRLSDFGKKQ